MDLAGGRTGRRAAAVLVAVAAVLIGASSAQAGTAFMTADGGFRFVAGPGEQNLVTAFSSGGAITLRDVGTPVSPGNGCAQGANAGEVRCPLPPGPCATADCGAIIDLGDADDLGTAANALGTSTVIRGGLGNDTLEGQRGSFRLEGGDGADRLLGGDGDDVLVGGGGSDVLQGRGGAHDVASYEDRTARVIVSLDRKADDGGPGEKDDVRTEDVTGGRGDDTITGDAGDNHLAGGPGRDTISCGPGDADVVDGDSGDAIRPDCEVAGLGRPAVRLPLLDALILRAEEDGNVTVALRWPAGAAGPADGRALGTIKLVAADGSARSIGTRYLAVPRGGVTTVRLRLTASSRRRLTQVPAIRLFAVRTVRFQRDGARLAEPGFSVLSAPVTIGRPL